MSIETCPLHIQVVFLSLSLFLSISFGEHTLQYINFYTPLVQVRAFVSPQRLTKDQRVFHSLAVFLKSVPCEDSPNHTPHFSLLCTRSQGERGSYTVQMWHYHMQGLRHDLCTFLAPVSYELAEKVLLGVLSGSLAHLTRRYSTSTPSHARLNQFR